MVQPAKSQLDSIESSNPNIFYRLVSTHSFLWRTLRFSLMPETTTASWICDKIAKQHQSWAKGQDIFYFDQSNRQSLSMFNWSRPLQTSHHSICLEQGNRFRKKHKISSNTYTCFEETRTFHVKFNETSQGRRQAWRQTRHYQKTPTRLPMKKNLQNKHAQNETEWLKFDKKYQTDRSIWRHSREPS